MASFNKAIICGHLGQDPRVSVTQSGKTVARLSVATSEKFGGQEKTEWHNVVAWEKTAEFCRDYLTKGALVLVEGRIETRKWEDATTGQDRYMTEIIAQRVQGLGKGKEGGQRDNTPGTAMRPGGMDPAFPSDTSGMDDVPF